MLRWFNHNRFVIFLLAQIACLLLLILSPIMGMDVRPSFVLFLFSVAVIYVLFILSDRLVKKEVLSATLIYSNQCDPQPLLNICTLQYDELERLCSDTSQYILYLRQNRVIALMELGRTEEGAAEMAALLSLLATTRGKITPLSILIYILHVEFLLRQGNLDAAESEISRLSDQISAPFLPPKPLPLLTHLLERCQHELEVRRGEWESSALEDWLLTRLNTAVALSERVHWSYQLGCFYSDDDRASEAVGHYQFVAEHGGTLAIRAKAKQLLELPAGSHLEQKKHDADEAIVQFNG